MLNSLFIFAPPYTVIIWLTVAGVNRGGPFPLRSFGGPDTKSTTFISSVSSRRKDKPHPCDFILFRVRVTIERRKKMLPPIFGQGAGQGHDPLHSFALMRGAGLNRPGRFFLKPEAEVYLAAPFSFDPGFAISRTKRMNGVYLRCPKKNICIIWRAF